MVIRNTRLLYKAEARDNVTQFETLTLSCDCSYLILPGMHLIHLYLV